QVADLGYRLTGSSDFYEQGGRRPFASVNFVTAHDGFTLADLVAYNGKHNEANGEDNRDGPDHNAPSNSPPARPTPPPRPLPPPPTPSPRRGPRTGRAYPAIETPTRLPSPRNSPAPPAPSPGRPRATSPSPAGSSGCVSTILSSIGGCSSRGGASTAP